MSAEKLNGAHFYVVKFIPFYDVSNRVKICKIYVARLFLEV